MAFTNGKTVNSERRKLENVDPSARFPGSPVDKTYSKKFREIKVPKPISKLNLEVNSLLAQLASQRKQSSGNPAKQLRSIQTFESKIKPQSTVVKGSPQAEQMTPVAN